MLVLSCRYADDRDAIHLDHGAIVLRAINGGGGCVSFWVRFPDGHVYFQRRASQTLTLGAVLVTVLQISPASCRLGFSAPEFIRIDRAKNVRRRRREKP